jgi:hypothetical protein
MKHSIAILSTLVTLSAAAVSTAVAAATAAAAASSASASCCVLPAARNASILAARANSLASFSP